MAVAVASGFVSEARSKLVVTCIRRGSGSTAAKPKASSHTSLPCTRTATTAPGAIALSMAASSTARAGPKAAGGVTSGAAVSEDGATLCTSQRIRRSSRKSGEPGTTKFQLDMLPSLPLSRASTTSQSYQSA